MQRASEPIKHLVNYNIGVVRNVLLGAGLCYAIEKENHWHLPVIFLFPSMYTGYQVFQNRDVIVKWAQSKTNQQQ
jgi:hypothetical protein